MESRTNNRKYVFFLLALSAFGFVLYRSFSKEQDVVLAEDISVKEDVYVLNNENVIERSACADEIQPELITDFVKLDLEKPIDITKEVLAGSDSSSSSCESFSQQFNISAMCSDGSASTDVEGGENNAGITYASKDGGEVDESDNVKIRLVEVTFPAQFWNGSKVVKDNTEAISKEDPVYNSSGDYLSLEYGQKFMTPQQAEEFESTKDNDRNAFSVIAKNKIALAEEISSQMGTYIVEKKANESHCSLCERNIQPSAFNPTVTNEVGNRLSDGLQIPGGDPKFEDSINTCVETSNTITYTMDNPEMYKTVCSEEGLLAKFIGRVKAFFSRDQWTECTVSKIIDLGDGTTTTEDDACRTKEDIIIEMTSVYGAVDECVDGVCGNAGLTRRFLGTQSPAQSDSYEVGSTSSDTSLTRAVLTPCKVVIDYGFSWNQEPVDVYCKWDATPNLANYRAQQVEKIPGDEEFPEDYDQYWKLVVKALERDSKLSSL